MTQCKAILMHLQAGHTITDESAHEICGTHRLSGRIYDLRRQGHNIVGVWREGTNRYGHKTKWMEYRLDERNIHSEN